MNPTSAASPLRIERAPSAGGTAGGRIDADTRIRIWFLILGMVLLCATLLNILFIAASRDPRDQFSWFNPLLAAAAFTGFSASARLAESTTRLLATGLHLLLVLLLSWIGPGDRSLPPEAASYSQLWVGLLVVLFALLVPLRLRWHILLALTMPQLFWLSHWLQEVDGGLSGAALLHRGLHGLLVGVGAVVAASATDRLVRAIRSARQRIVELGSWELEERLGAGGMGEVWSARHRMLKSIAAIKLVHADHSDPTAGQRFDREARATAALRSSHTVRLFDYGIDANGAFYYVMELLDGVDTEQLVADGGPLPPARAIHLVRQACLSLAEAHRNGLVHRDIKPANLFCCRDGVLLDHCKVLDFGLVVAVRESDQPAIDAHRLTEGHLVYGTPQFIAPEQAQADPATDHRADIYALGGVLHYLLTGRPPFSAATPMDLLVAHIRDPAPRLTEEDCPAALAAIVAQCLAKNPDDRPADCTTLAQLLADCPITPWWQTDAVAAVPWRSGDASL